MSRDALVLIHDEHDGTWSLGRPGEPPQIRFGDRDEAEKKADEFVATSVDGQFRWDEKRGERYGKD